MRAAPIALLCVLAGCASSLVDYEARVHVVQPGETLYGIAWRYRLDHRDLARWNRLGDPDFIQVGQRIRLTPPDGGAPALVRSSSSGGAARGTSVAALPRATPTPRSVPAAPALPPPAWRWPTAGAVVSAFGSASGIPTGIGIGGRAGQPVEAAAEGRVVYAGTGLIGYGQLVIIQHNDTYLTAYGHNQRLLVEQGQSVARGQQIAEMGFGPARQPLLHFEIRRNGTPVDPLLYLSARR